MILLQLISALNTFHTKSPSLNVTWVSRALVSFWSFRMRDMQALEQLVVSE